MTIIDANSGEVMLVDTARARFADRINSAWNQTLDGILDVGRLLCEAKAEIPRGSFEEMIERDLRFGPRTARMLMAVHRSERLRNHGSVLPTAWRTLYDLTTLSDEAFEVGLEHNLIRPDMERKELTAIKNLMREAKREETQAVVEDGCTVEDLTTLAAAGKKFSVIYADPPWSFKVYSGKGKARSAERHYDTKSLDDIKALPVAPLTGEDCALLLWAVMPQIPEALEVIAAWGFTFKTVAFTWVKQNRGGDGLFTGMGYWTRANAELCLLATKGAPKRQAMDVHQVILSPVGEHSRKPDEAQVRIERLLPGPYLELYGRRASPGWTVWGNQVERNMFHQDIPEFAA